VNTPADSVQRKRHKLTCCPPNDNIKQNAPSSDPNIELPSFLICLADGFHCVRTFSEQRIPLLPDPRQEQDEVDQDQRSRSESKKQNIARAHEAILDYNNK
jgi:hypothetical protein